MFNRKTASGLCVLVIYLFLGCWMVFAAEPGNVEPEREEFRAELGRTLAMRKSLQWSNDNSLAEYETFANEIQARWRGRNKEDYARLMLKLCSPLTSGFFKERRRTALARSYAMSALSDPNGISLETQLALTGHVMTRLITRGAPQGQEWAKIRRANVGVRLVAWKRLLEAADWTWDPNDCPTWNVTPPAGAGRSGIPPEYVKDAKLRLQYEAAIRRNNEKAQTYLEQYRIRQWLSSYPPRAEKHIIRAYSRPPYNFEELKQSLDNYVADERTKTRILDKVKNNMPQTD